MNSKQRIREYFHGAVTSELTVIPAKSENSELRGAVRKVSAYIHVSTDNDDQRSLFELQKNYFTEYVRARHRWSDAGNFLETVIEKQFVGDDKHDGKRETGSV